MEKKLMDEDKSPPDVETDTDVPDGNPESSRRCIAPNCQNNGNAGDTIDGRQKIGMKPIVSEVLSTPGDAIICLWSMQNVHTGEHSLLSVAGPVIEDWNNFKHQVAFDQVVETKGGNLETGRILHCKYDHVSRHVIASAVIKCIAFAERKKVAIIVFPLEYFDEVQDKPGMVTEALMIAISQTQKIHRYAQHLRKILICLNSEGKEKFVSVRNRSFKRRSDTIDGRQKIGMKPIVSDVLSTPGDAVICLWSTQNVHTGEHSLLSVAGPVIEDWNNFKHQVAFDQVVETKGGNLETGRILHCKYDHVSRHEIASAVIKCIAFAERKKVAIIVFPLEYFDEVQDKPGMVTEALMIAISVTQKIHRYAQHLRKLVICLNSEGKEKQCRREFVSVRNRSFKRRKCLKCEGKNAVRLSPKSRGPCTRECAVFCMNCLQQVEHCQHHGPCLTPIGHENSFAILVSGFDRSVTNARVFKKETKEMMRLLQSAEHVGLRKDNVLVINPGRAGKEEEMKSRVLAAFRTVKSQIDRTKPSSFIFYFSGHNSTGLVLGEPNDVLTPRELKKEFHKLKVDEITSVLDCCYSGGSGLTQRLDSEDYTVSMCSLEGVDSLMFLPRLWNLQQDLRSPGSKVTRIYQLSSSVASEKSFLRDTKSVFTDALITIVMGDCPLRDPKCEHCNDFSRRAKRADGIFLNDLHDSLTLHVGLLESQQHPELRGNDDTDILFAYLI